MHCFPQSVAMYRYIFTWIRKIDTFISGVAANKWKMDQNCQNVTLVTASFYLFNKINKAEYCLVITVDWTESCWFCKWRLHWKLFASEYVTELFLLKLDRSRLDEKKKRDNFRLMKLEYFKKYGAGCVLYCIWYSLGTYFREGP